jgi:lipoprotein-anchoring transpeptidase ErfK/SrfK
VAEDGRLFRTQDVTSVAARERPAEAANEEKWIDVNLTHQYLVAYEGERPVFATLISSGVIEREDVPELNHATPTGVFRIKSKHLATTMDGDNAFDGPYSIQDVPYVMYYELGYALHSAFWHNVFGRPKSHGCVNLSPLDARWVFEWSTPELPDGWHGVYPNDENPGTMIVIHGETPLRGRRRPR